MLHSLGEWTEALGHLQSAIQLNPESADYHLLKSQIFMMLNRFDDAEFALRRAGKLGCGFRRYLKLKGIIELKKLAASR